MPKSNTKPRRGYPARPRGILEQFFIAQWSSIVEKVYGPIRREQARLQAQERRELERAAALCLEWRLDAIELEFSRVRHLLNGFINVTMATYGYHYHRGQWRRHHASKEERARQNAFIEQDQVAGTEALFGSGPHAFEAIPGYHIGALPLPEPSTETGPKKRGPKTAPSNSEKNRASVPQTDTPEGTAPKCEFVSDRVSSRVTPASEPGVARDEYLFYFPEVGDGSFIPPGTQSAPQSARDWKPAPLPDPSRLPFNPPFDPMFPRAMDGTTFQFPKAHLQFDPDDKRWSHFPPLVPDDRHVLLARLHYRAVARSMGLLDPDWWSPIFQAERRRYWRFVRKNAEPPEVSDWDVTYPPPTRKRKRRVTTDEDDAHLLPGGSSYDYWKKKEPELREARRDYVIMMYGTDDPEEMREAKKRHAARDAGLRSPPASRS